MSKDLTRRVKKKAGIEITTITRSSLRGDMQDRLHRQEIIRVSDIKKKNKKIKDKLSRIDDEVGSSFGGIEDFDEPVFRRIRSRRGFF